VAGPAPHPHRHRGERLRIQPRPHLEILEFLATLRHHASLPHRRKDAEAAAILAGALRNRMDNV